MNGKILSIVVPAYNVEKYLHRCLDSFVVEEILDKIEVLVINDGSKDGTADIAKEYCDKYPQTFFLFNKENGGHGSGINHGILHATGKYFKVVDGDDWLKTEELPAFVNTLENVDTDIVAADFLCIQDETDKVLDEKYCTQKQEQYGKVCSMESGEIENVIKMHALTIRTEILKKNNIVIDEHCFYVDAEYIMYPIPYVKTVYFYNKFLYMYRLGRSGQSMDIRNMQKRRGQHMNVLNNMLAYYSCVIEAGAAGTGEVGTGASETGISGAKTAKDAKVMNVSAENIRYMEKCIGQMVENQFQIYISMGLQKGILGELKAWDLDLKKKYPRVYTAVNKKSITLLRRTGYLILPVGALVYKIVK